MNKKNCRSILPAAMLANIVYTLAWSEIYNLNNIFTAMDFHLVTLTTNRSEENS